LQSKLAKEQFAPSGADNRVSALRKQQVVVFSKRTGALQRGQARQGEPNRFKF